MTSPRRGTGVGAGAPASRLRDSVRKWGHVSDQLSDLIDHRIVGILLFFGVFSHFPFFPLGVLA